jgi:hypothetical protein
LAQTTVEVAEVDQGGGHGVLVVRLDAALGEATVWIGSELSVLVAADRSGPVAVPHEVRGALTLTGDPRSWLGTHRTSVDSVDRWRLKVSIAEGAATA